MRHANDVLSFGEAGQSRLVELAQVLGDGVMDALHQLLDDPQPSVVSALALGRRLGDTGIRPGIGRTQSLWELLATIGAHDLGAVRAIEPHLDAVAILAEARAMPGPNGTWGVFAAEGGPAVTPLTARRGSATDGGSNADSFTLTGTKPWCSLADCLDRALVTATLAGSTTRQLFAVDLKHHGVRVETSGWVARGLAEIPSGPVRFDDVPAEPVGDPGWYLTRAGFSWGGIEVAACWYGGAVGLARTLFDAARPAHALPASHAEASGAPGSPARVDNDLAAASATPAAVSAPSPLLLMHLGAVDALLADCRRALREAAALVDSGAATGDDGRLLAKRVRATVARSSEGVLRHVAHALGPAPLAQNEQHAKRVADLELYLRQHHAEQDDASLGAHLLKRTERPW